jgi:ankyrin repeat protein
MFTVESIVSSQSRTPAFLHHGLADALRSGRVDVARYLVKSGAPIARKTPEFILTAPADQQIALFEVLTEHGWTVNTPGFYGAVLLPRLTQTNNETLIDWFLAHGADPNLGVQHDNRERLGGPDTDSCQALELAASWGSVQMMQKLLNAGAKITNGAPLYYAAGACPPGANPQAGRVTPSKEFDSSVVPVMALLVENGAGVNDKLESRHMTPQYPIVNAVMAGAVERVKWLLSQGADPDLKGQYGSARDYARVMSSDEMKQALGLL